jgi:hypothetical protein
VARGCYCDGTNGPCVEWVSLSAGVKSLDGGGILVLESADDPSYTTQLESLGISLDEFVENVSRSRPGKVACPLQVNENHVEDRKSKMMRDGIFL